jgi:hypothetical protein
LGHRWVSFVSDLKLFARIGERGRKKKKGSKDIRSHFGSFTPPTCMFAFIFLLLGALQTVCSLVRAL